MYNELNNNLSCTLNLDVCLREEKIEEEEELPSYIPPVSRNKYYLRVTELLIVSFRDEIDFGDLYFMILDPVTQSESY